MHYNNDSEENPLVSFQRHTMFKKKIAAVGPVMYEGHEGVQERQKAI